MKFRLFTNPISRKRYLKMRRHAKRAIQLGKPCTMRIGIWQQIQWTPAPQDPTPLNLQELINSHYAVRRQKLQDAARRQRLEEIKARDRMSADEYKRQLYGTWK